MQFRGYRFSLSFGFIAGFVFLALLVNPLGSRNTVSVHAAPVSVYEGFGANATGGSQVYSVTSLSDADAPGTLRRAFSECNTIAPTSCDRRIVFSVGGTITVSSPLRLIKAAGITIDGLTAPSPGVTLQGGLLELEGVSNLIVRGLRIRNTPDDAIRIWDGGVTAGSTRLAPHDIVIVHNTVEGAGDGAIDITERAYNITVAHNILSQTVGAGAMLIKYNGTRRISLYRNLYYRNGDRSPLAAGISEIEMYNNVVYGWGGYGTWFCCESTGNLIANYYIPTERDHRAMWLGAYPPTGDTAPGPVYLAGWRSGDALPNNMPPATWDMLRTADNPAMVNTPYAYGVTGNITTAAQALQDVLNNAGAIPRTATEQAWIAEVQAAAGGTTPTPTPNSTPTPTPPGSTPTPTPTLTPTPTTQPPVSSTGLIAAYSFSEGGGNVSVDRSGNGNNGTLSGGAGWTAGRNGTGLEFTSSGLFTVPDANILDLSGDMTLEVWVLPTSTTTNGRLITKMTSANTNGYDLMARGSTYATMFNSTFDVSTSAVTAWEWQHIAVTKSGTTVRFYKNGTLITSWTTAPATIGTNSSPLLIGSAFGSIFSGRIDDVRMYGRALSQSEIQSNMNTPVAQTTPGLKPGDIDRDGDVDIFDYNRLVGRFGQTGSMPEDIDNNAVVNIFDYNLLVTNFGT